MNENQGGAFYAPDTRNWWQRLLARLFPAKLVDLPDDAEGFAPGYTRTDVHAPGPARPAAHAVEREAARGGGEPDRRDRSKDAQRQHVLGGSALT